VKVRNIEVRKMICMKKAVAWAEMLKWRWGGHVARINLLKWTYAAAMWYPRIGKRNLGGPKIRWSDIFERIAETRCTNPVIVVRFQQKAEYPPLQD
jgi:hypothetical protein